MATGNEGLIEKHQLGRDFGAHHSPISKEIPKVKRQDICQGIKTKARKEKLHTVMNFGDGRNGTKQGRSSVSVAFCQLNLYFKAPRNIICNEKSSGCKMYFS